MSPKQAYDKLIELSEGSFIFPKLFQDFIDNSKEPLKKEIKQLKEIIYKDPKITIIFLSAYGKRCPVLENNIINDYYKKNNLLNCSSEFSNKLMCDHSKLISDYINNLSQEFPDRWTKAEEIILKGNPSSVYLYFKSLKKFFANRWEKAEPVLSKQMSVFHQYVLDCEKPNETYEQKILNNNDNKSNAKYIYEYSTKILKNRWLEAEHILFKNQFYLLKYSNKFKLPIPEEDHNRLLSEVAFDDKCPAYKKKFIRRKR
jgi:hypothetical protein